MQNKHANKASPQEYLEEPRQKPELKELPPSTDKGFWGEDADINLIHKDQLQRHTPNCGSFRQQGPFVICGTCPNAHTIPGFTLNLKGELVKA